MAGVQSQFLKTLSQSPHAFLIPDLPIQTDVLQYVKDLLDPIAAEISTTQQQRQRDARRKRKRGDTVSEQEPLRLRQVHVSNLAVEQVWEQAKRVIDATRREAQRSHKDAQASERDKEEHNHANNDGEEDQEEDEDSDDSAEYRSVEEDLDSDGDITKEALGDNEDVDMDVDSEEPDDEDDLKETQPAEEFVQDKFGLNDGFFSIDNFNKQSEFLEQQDIRGDNDGGASDEEDIDWDVDPSSTMVNASASKTLAKGAARLQLGEDDDEDGPTFGDPDAPSEDDDDEDIDDGGLDGLGGLGNTNNVLYADFFAPPARKKSKQKQSGSRSKPDPKQQEQDVQRTMQAVHRDLFEDDDEDDVDNEETEELDPSDPRSRKSAHERRQAALAEEIRKLEQANVSKREWTMSGEARAADRPINSLLEEDLEFERTGKPVPVITAEISESIEELIKRRILAQDFQDIARRRPDDLATGKDNRRGRMELTLDDSKSKKGLAEEYEEEHLRKTDPNFVDVNDEKLAKEQREIEALWRDVCSKLDGLSSWHFRPKRPQAQLDIRVDAPTIAMEDARPNAGGEVAGASQLAPQEVYRAGDGSKGINEEVVGKSGLPAQREELTQDQRKSRRRREKERIRKSNTNEAAAKKESKSSQEKQAMLGDLKKGNVKVIGKQGELTDVGGNTVAGGMSHTAAKFKL